MPEETSLSSSSRRTSWNKGKLIGAKPPLRTNQVWSIRTRLMIRGRTRDLCYVQLGDRRLSAGSGHKRTRGVSPARKKSQTTKAAIVQRPSGCQARGLRIWR